MDKDFSLVHTNSEMCNANETDLGFTSFLYNESDETLHIEIGVGDEAQGTNVIVFYADTENTTARSANLANGQSLDLPIHDDQIYYFAIESSKSMYCVAIGPSFFRNASKLAVEFENI